MLCRTFPEGDAAGGPATDWVPQFCHLCTSVGKDGCQGRVARGRQGARQGTPYTVPAKPHVRPQGNKWAGNLLRITVVVINSCMDFPHAILIMLQSVGLPSKQEKKKSRQGEKASSFFIYSTQFWCLPKRYRLLINRKQKRSSSFSMLVPDTSEWSCHTQLLPELLHLTNKRFEF